MSPRERVLQAIKRGTPDKVPKEFGFTPALMERFQLETGSANPADYFGMETRHVDFAPLREEDTSDFSEYMRDLPPESRIMSEYGTASVPANFHHFWGYVFPLRHAQSVQDIERYPWPDMTLEYRHVRLEEQVSQLHEKEYFVTGFAGHIFETAWQLIGFEKMFEDLLLNPAPAEAVLEYITRDNCFRAQRFAEAGVDMLRLGDDVGMEDRLMLAPDLWRTYLKPRLAREIEAARAVSPDLPVWYHSDGDISLIIDDLIEVGVTVLNPVQPECLDVHEIQRKYGDQLAFWGTIGTQTVMPFGTPDTVKQTVREMIDLFAPGLVIAPTHVLEPDVPWENILALFEAIEEYGHLD
jgi:uroporphyrinogen decarboxylase